MTNIRSQISTIVTQLLKPLSPSHESDGWKQVINVLNHPHSSQSAIYERLTVTAQQNIAKENK